MKLLGYKRVSSDEQAEEGVSLAAQDERIRMFCTLHGHELIGIEEDAGFSGKDMKRPGLQRCLEMVRSGGADGIVVTKLDRLTRSVRDLQYLIENVFGGHLEAALCSVFDSIDTNSATGRLQLNVIMSVLQWEREIIGERTREGLRHKKSKGEMVGRVPYGKDLAEDGATLVDNSAEQAVIADILKMREANLSYKKIAHELNSRGVPTKDAGKKRGSRTIVGRWAAMGVHNLVNHGAGKTAGVVS